MSDDSDLIPKQLRKTAVWLLGSYEQIGHRLRDNLDWLDEPSRRRQMSRRIAIRTYRLMALTTRMLIWLAVFIVSIFGEAWFAKRAGQEPNFVLATLAFLGIFTCKVFFDFFWRRIRASLRNGVRRTKLLPAVALAAIGGGSIVLVSLWALRKILHPTTKSPDPIDVTKLALTIAGGVGAVVALVVAYRRQRDVEQGRFVERFGAAAAQLGSNQVAVRIAGVYAMAGVADESRGLQRQQCIDVLCGYLRLPYSAERGSNYQTKQVIKSKAAADAILEIEDHFEYPQNDREVRLTILRVIADHLRSYEFNWSTLDFDFRGADLEDVNFSHTTFKGLARFMGSRFIGEAHFDGARLTGWASFDGCTFEGRASFNRARIYRASFEAANFESKASFYHTEFDDDANFAGAKFSSVRFVGCSFSGYRTDFEKSIFNGEVTFDGMVDGYCDFSESTFEDEAHFSAKFQSTANFKDVNFGSKVINFENVRKWGGPWSNSRFDWSGDRSLKPQNVKPYVWPNSFP